MNRIDRLFGILLKLQSKKPVHSRALAEAFEVSERTIFRDIAALTEMGVPISAEWGEGYTLMEGFYLPPLVFTPDEASALVLGARMLSRQAAGKLADASLHALEKLNAALPKPAQEHVEELSETIRFMLPPHKFNLDDERLLALRNAIKNQRVIAITYHSFTRLEVTKRQVEPHELLYTGGAWYVHGFCRLRQDTREFRLDRIDELRLLDEKFIRRREKHATRDLNYEVVQLRFNAEDRRWVEEYQHYAFQGSEVSPDGSVMMTYHPQQAIEMKQWLLMWGARVNILAPLSLREAIREEAIQLAKLLT